MFKKKKATKRLQRRKKKKNLSLDLKPFYTFSDVVYDPAFVFASRQNTRPSLLSIRYIILYIYIYHWFKTPIGYYKKKIHSIAFFLSLFFFYIRLSAEVRNNIFGRKGVQ